MFAIKHFVSTTLSLSIYAFWQVQTSNQQTVKNKGNVS
jgi:hypothetical protein